MRQHPGFLVALTIAAWPALASDLTVTLQNVRSNDGQVKLMLFNREEGFRKEDKALHVLVQAARIGDVSSVFRDIQPGRYAVIAYHDENGDGKLNLRFGMFPIEGYGLSNNPKLSGPPKFKDAVFEVTDASKHADIRLSY